MNLKFVYNKIEELYGESDTLFIVCIFPNFYYFWKNFLANILFCKFYVPTVEKTCLTGAYCNRSYNICVMRYL